MKVLPTLHINVLSYAVAVARSARRGVKLQLTMEITMVASMIAALFGLDGINRSLAPPA